MKAWLAASTLALSALAHGAENRSPEQTVQSFYGWLLKPANLQTSLPSPKQRAVLRELLSADLMTLLDEASKTESQCVKVAPKDSKPLIVEGALFVGNYEGANEAIYDEPKLQGDAATVEVSLFSVSPSYPKGHRLRGVAWKDVVQLARHDGRWIINDILFRQNETGSAGGKASLSGELKSYIDDGKSCSSH
jgi:hypothetical protein